MPRLKNNLRSEIIPVRFSPTEKRALIQAAKNCKFEGVGAYIRSALFFGGLPRRRIK